MRNLKHNTDELSCERETDARYREQSCGCHRGEGGEWMNWESGISRCKPLYI